MLSEVYSHAAKKKYCVLMVSMATIIVILSICFAVVRSYSNLENKVYNLKINPEVTKVVIDTDAGVDDALGILLLLAAEARHGNKFEIVAITCTYGNTAVDNVVQNVLKTLTVAERDNIPVYRGAHEPLISNYTDGKFFGDDGFGDVDFDQEIIGKYDTTKHASMALIEIVKKHPGKISILALGSLTNIALAIKMDSQFVKNVETFYVMGGSVHGLGNTAPNVEFNFSLDPESNYILFNSVTDEASIVLLPWETSISAGITKDWRLNVFGTYNSSFVKFLNKIEKFSLSNIEVWSPADAIAAAIMLWPDLVNKSVVVNACPVIDGAARGSLLLDYTHLNNKLNNTAIADEFNTDAFLHILIEYVAL